MARRGSGKTIDYKEWTGMNFSDQTAAADGTLIGAGLISFAVPATILRARGFVQASFDATQQVGDRMRVTWGLGIVSTDAATLGATAVPDPAGEPEYPWLWWGSMLLRSELAAGVNAWGLSAQRLEVDTKAMRRVKPGQSLVWVMEAASTAGAPATLFEFGQTRVLIGT